MPLKSLEKCRLYGFVDEAYRHGRTYESLAKALCAGGVDIIQLRMKGASTSDIMEAASKIHPITESSGVHLVINDSLDVASQLPNSFVHLGQEDFFDNGYEHLDDLVRSNPKTHIRLGLSTHAPDQAMRAVHAGADYVAIGPVFATPTKPTAVPVTLNYVQWAAKHIRIPWFCIGGINLSNLQAVLEAGAQRICVVSAFLNAIDVEKECDSYRKALDGFFS